MELGLSAGCQPDTRKKHLERSLREEVSKLGWPVDTPMRDFLNWDEKAHPVGSTISGVGP